MNSQPTSGISSSQSEQNISSSSSSSLPHPPPPPSDNSSIERMILLENKVDALTESLANLVSHLTNNSRPSPSHDEHKAVNPVYANRIDTPIPQGAHSTSSGAPFDQPHSHQMSSSGAPFDQQNYRSTSFSPHINRSSQSSPTTVTFSTTSSDSHRPYNNRIKFNAPTTFTGKPPVDAITILGFTKKMDHYLTAVNVEHHTAESLNVAIMSLGDFALLWYEQTIKNNTNIIRNWNELRERLLKKYKPVAQEQASFDILSEITYRGSVQSYIHEFQNNLQLIPDLNIPATQKMLMNIFINRMSKAPGTHFICTAMRTAMSRDNDECTDLTALEAVALTAESNLGKTAGRNIPYVPPFSRNNNNNHTQQSSSHNHRSNNNYRGNSFRPQFGRTPVAAPSFSTPAKLNNVYIENDNDDTDPAIAYENEFNDNCGPFVHHDPNEFSSNVAPTEPDFSPNGANTDDVGLLNHIKLYDRSVKYNPSLTPEEWDRRRKNQTCFRCNKTGHFANKCPLPPPSNQSKNY